MSTAAVGADGASDSSADDGLFPLSLTSFEEYMLCDDRPSHPMLGIGRLRFSGYLDRNALEAAVSVAVSRHALLRSSIRRRRRGKPYWIEHPDWSPVVDWESKTNKYGYPDAPYVDIETHPGTRFWVVDHGEGHDVVLQIHHCAADAIGIGQIMEDLLVSYALRIGALQNPGDLIALEPQRLRKRGAPALASLQLRDKTQLTGLVGVWEFMTRRPVPLIGKTWPYDPAILPAAFPCPRVVELDPQETGRLLALAKAMDVTVNDLMLRDLFVALIGWRKDHGVGNDRDWLRISVPMNLRGLDDSRMPMANSVSMVFPDRRGIDAHDRSDLLRGIRYQMQKIKRRHLKYTFLYSLAAIRFIPGGLAAKTRANSLTVTSSLSNLGVVLARTPLPRRDGRLVVGNLELQSVDFVIPIRPHVHGAFCSYTYAGRLRVLLHPDARVVSDDQTEQFLDRFVRELRRTAAESNLLEHIPFQLNRDVLSIP